MALSISEDDLNGLVVMEAESLGLEDYRDASATDALREAWGEYEDDLREALQDHLDASGPDGVSVEQLMDEGAASLYVWLTLADHRAGIWDGRWEAYFTDEQVDELKDELKDRLGKWEHTLAAALVEAAEDTAGDGDEEEGLDDEGREDDEE